LTDTHFITSITRKRAASAVNISETTSSQLSLEVELPRLSVSYANAGATAWAARYKTWLLIKLTPKGIVFSFLFLGATALMAAAGKGRLHELSMLLAAGAKPELHSKGGTAREWALRFGHTEAAEMLQLHEEAAEAADAAAGGAVALSHYQAGGHMQLCLPEV